MLILASSMLAGATGHVRAQEKVLPDSTVRVGDHVVVLSSRHNDPVAGLGMVKVMDEVGRQLRAAGLRVSLLDDISQKTLK